MTIQTFEIKHMSPAKQFTKEQRTRMLKSFHARNAKNETKAKLTKLFDDNRKRKLKTKSRRKK